MLNNIIRYVLALEHNSTDYSTSSTSAASAIFLPMATFEGTLARQEGHFLLFESVSSRQHRQILCPQGKDTGSSNRLRQTKHVKCSKIVVFFFLLDSLSLALVGRLTDIALFPLGGVKIILFQISKRYWYSLFNRVHRTT